MAKTKRTLKKVAFLFGEGGPASARDLGGKGAGLNELARLGLPVPLGFTVTTAVARAYAQHQAVPNRLPRQLTWGIAGLEKASGKRFGSAANPLLVSVRSGAQISMPGMMDTVLNLGINPEIAAGLARLHGKRFAYDCYRRFLEMFGDVVLGVHRGYFESILAAVKERRHAGSDRDLDGEAWQEVVNRFRNLIAEKTGKPMVDEPWQQLMMALNAVLASWDNPRAKEYRKAKGIPENLGTAVNVQTMVYGNLDDSSGTGVAFGRNTVTGEPGLWGEFLIQAQGEDVVAGTRTPMPLSAMANWNGRLGAELAQIVDRLDNHFGYVVDVEFTIEAGKLFILQVRRAKLSPEAAVTVATHAIWSKRVTKEAALGMVSEEQLAAVKSPPFNPQSLAEAVATRLLARGLSASPGAACGRVVTTSEQAVEAARRGESVILVRPDTSPDDLPGMLAAVAIVTMTGGYTSHAAVVARDLGKPCVVGCSGSLSPGSVVSVDGQSGVVVSGRVPITERVAKKEVNLFLKWRAEAEAKKWPKPRLNFERVNQRVEVSQMINDFYLTDRMAGAAKGSSLESAAILLRTRVHSEVADRLAMYLVVAIGGEIRHASRSWMDGWDSAYRDANLKALVDEYQVELDGNDRESAQVVHTNRLKAMSHEQHVRFVELVARVFDNGRWSGSVGGRKWGQIAWAAHGFLTGKLSHSLFADHAFDLQHNNGTVFGKNSMLSGNRSEITRRLDAKKYAGGVTDLYRRLTELTDGGYAYGGSSYDSGYYRRESRPLYGFSAEVEALYRKGQRAGLWQ